MSSFRDVKVGDTVTRNFAGIIQEWKVTEVTDRLIICGMGWSFDRETGWEEDEDCGWGVAHGRTGSHLIERVKNG